MSDHVFLSVIITFCRQKQFVHDCLRSVLKQDTRFTYEILIAVDGEDDGIMAILEEYTALHDNIKVWKVQSDERYLAMSRASHNRLFLLKKAKGDFFITLDGDDFFCNVHRFEEGIDFLLKNKSYIGHACEWIKYDHINTSFLNETYQRKKQIITKNDYIEKKLYIHASCFIFRNIFKTMHTVYKEEDFFDDICISQFMLQFGSAYFTGKRMFGYRVNILSTFLGLSQKCRDILQVSTYTKLYDITKHGMYNFYASEYIIKIINNNDFNFPDNLKKSIIFQNRILAKDIVRINEMTYEERNTIMQHIHYFCNYWTTYRKEFLKRTDLLRHEKSESPT